MDNVTPVNESKSDVANSAKKSSGGFLGLMKNIFVGFFSFIFKMIKGFLSFFFDLKFAGKLSFLIILVVFSFVGFLFGRNSGQNSVEREVKDKTGYEVNDLGDLVKEIRNLENQIKSLRKN